MVDTYRTAMSDTFVPVSNNGTTLYNKLTSICCKIQCSSMIIPSCSRIIASGNISSGNFDNSSTA